MAAQVITIERRQHSREGVMAQLEDITYRLLRRYDVVGEMTQPIQKTEAA